VDDFERAIENARASASALVKRAADRMLSGADADRIHATYVVRGLPYSASLCSDDFSRKTAFVWSCDTRDSVTPSTSPISRSVRFS
jgi:hypothetical protein